MISRNFASRLFVVTLMVVLLSAFAFAPVQAAPAGQGVRILPKAQEAPIDWSADFVLGLISAGMSLVFAYLPYLKEWYDSLDSRTKPLVMLILITVLVWGKLALTCAFDWSCIQAGAGEAFLLWMGCLVANSQTYEKFIRQQKQAAREKARVELQNRLGVTSR